MRVIVCFIQKVRKRHRIDRENDRSGGKKNTTDMDQSKDRYEKRNLNLKGHGKLEIASVIQLGKRFAGF